MSSLSVVTGFQEGCRGAEIDPSKGPVVVGVSGGCDSMVLASLMVEAGFDVRVAHVNHGLRAASMAEEDLVRQWSQVQDVPFHTLGPPDVQPPQTGKQAWARELRYAFFQRVARACAAQAIAVAHHADDLLETILLNLGRGTGPAGLIGMATSRAVSNQSGIRLVRPLLSVPGKRLYSYARSVGLTWMHDASNDSQEYTRNSIRAELGAMAEKDLMEFRQAGVLLSQRVHALRQHMVYALQDAPYLDSDDLDAVPVWMRTWCVLEWMQLHAPDLPRRQSMARAVLDLIPRQAGRKVSFGNCTIWRDRRGLRITTDAMSAESQPRTVSVPPLGSALSVPTDSGCLHIEHTQCSMQDRAARTRHAMDVVLDAAVLDGDVCLRPWLPGDRFQPPGMEGHKKVKTFLTDCRVPPSRRAAVPVLADQKGILWVIGHEIDARARLVDSTRTGLRLRWTPDRGLGQARSEISAGPR